MNSGQIAENIWKSIDRLKSKLCLDDKQISSFLSLDPHSFQKLQNQRKDIPATALISLCSAFNIDEKTLCLNQVNYEKVKRDFYGIGPAKLSQKYSSAAFSKMFAIGQLYEFSKRLGKEDFFLRKLELDESLLKTDLNVNCELVSDGLKILSPYSTSLDIHHLSYNTAMKFHHSPLAPILKQAKSFKELYEIWVAHGHIFENNWIYQIHSSTDERVRIHSYARPELIETFKSPRFSSLGITKIRVEVASYLPFHIGLPQAQYRIIKSVHYGDPYCVFEFTNTAIS